MSDLKPKGVKIVLNGKEYGMRFTLNAIDDIQEHFNISVENLGELFKESKDRIKNLRYLLTLLINEDIDCRNDELSTTEKESLLHIDERYVGRHIDATNMREIMASIMKSFTNGTPEPDGEDPNA